MAKVDVTVHITKFGNPDLSLTARQLGQRARSGGRASDVWEIVRLFNGKASLNPPGNVAQVGGCNFVQDLHIHIHFGLEYFIASELQNNLNDARNAGETQLANFHGWLLNTIKTHAGKHYEQFVKVIMAWEGDVKDDLVKTLPTEQKPTSSNALDIRNGIGVLVSDWVVELDYRLNRRAFEWEKLDYPKIEADMKRQTGASVFMPMGFSLPSAPQSPAPRRKVAFPPCRPRK